MKHILPLMLCAGLAAAQDVVTFGDAATGTRVYTTDGTDHAIAKALDAFDPVMVETDPAFTLWTNSEAVVLGRDAGHSDLQFSVAVGNGALAGEEFATAIGAGATATNVSATAIGCGARAFGESATAIGNGSKALETGSTALGNAAAATGGYSLAWGDHAQATATLATALGPYSTASADHAYAIGKYAVATADSALALGEHAEASRARSTALGLGAQAAAHDAVQIGQGVNDTPGTLQFRSWPLVDSDGKIPLGRLPSNYGDFEAWRATNSLAAGEGAAAEGWSTTAIGHNSEARGGSAVALGSNVHATDSFAVALGCYETSATGAYATAVGSWTRAEASTSIAIGCSATAKARGAVQLGEGTNEKVQSLQFREWTLVDELGQIPLERLGDAMKKLMYEGIEIEGHLYKIAFIQID